MELLGLVENFLAKWRVVAADIHPIHIDLLIRAQLRTRILDALPKGILLTNISISHASENEDGLHAYTCHYQDPVDSSRDGGITVSEETPGELVEDIKSIFAGLDKSFSEIDKDALLLESSLEFKYVKEREKQDLNFDLTVQLGEHKAELWVRKLPKKNCRRCSGRGFTAWSVKTKKFVLCTCVVAAKNKQN